MMRRILLIPALALGLLWMIWFRPVYLGGPAAYVIVSGSSMEPELHTGDLVITQRQPAYDVGDVVAYRVDAGFVIHRVVGGSAYEGFDTQGDNRQSPDPWHPTTDQIEGKLWMHLPNAGRWVGLIRQPLVFASLAVGLAVVAFPPKKRIRHKTRARMRSYLNRTLSPIGESAVLAAVLSISGLLTVAAVVFAVASFSKPLQVTGPVERSLYTHNGSFVYTVLMEPSTLNPEGVLGPVAPSPDEDSNEPEPISVFTRLAPRLDLSFTYLLDAPASASLEGEFLPLLRVDAGGAWSKSLELSPPAQFAGNTFSGLVHVDFEEVLGLIETIEEETGYQAGTYTLSVVPTIRIHGEIGSKQVEDIYAPEFVMSLIRGQVLLDGDLARSEDRTTTVEVAKDNTISVMGQSMTVNLARWSSLIGVIILLVATLLLVWVGVLGLGQSDDARIQARYGSLILSIKRQDLAQGGRTVDMDSIDDLARLAQQTGHNIFHLRLGRISHLYFVEDGGVTYRHVTPGSRMERWRL